MSDSVPSVFTHPFGGLVLNQHLSPVAGSVAVSLVDIVCVLQKRDKLVRCNDPPVVQLLGIFPLDRVFVCNAVHDLLEFLDLSCDHSELWLQLFNLGQSSIVRHDGGVKDSARPYRLVGLFKEQINEVSLYGSNAFFHGCGYVLWPDEAVTVHA